MDQDFEDPEKSRRKEQVNKARKAQTDLNDQIKHLHKKHSKEINEIEID